MLLARAVLRVTEIQLRMHDTEYRRLLRLLDTTLLLIDRGAASPERLQRRLGKIVIEVGLLRARLEQPLPSTRRN